jgi:hypothetical protein
MQRRLTERYVNNYYFNTYNTNFKTFYEQNQDGEPVHCQNEFEKVCSGLNFKTIISVLVQSFHLFLCLHDLGDFDAYGIL